MKNIAQTQKRLQKEYQQQKQNPNSQFIAEPDKDNFLLWHFVLFNLRDSVFESGIYLGHVILPSEYPLKPPNIQFVTPNGRFQVNENICLSFTKFHPENWSPLWNIETMITALISFMFDREHTTGGVITSDSVKRKLAQESIRFNMNINPFNRHFKKHFQRLGITQQAVQSKIDQLNLSKSQKIQEQKWSQNNEIFQNIFLILAFLGLAIAYYQMKQNEIL